VVDEPTRRLARSELGKIVWSGPCGLTYTGTGLAEGHEVAPNKEATSVPPSARPGAATAEESAVRFGRGGYVYELDAAWGQLPVGWEYGDAVGVRVDSQDRIYVFNRGAHPIVVFDREGTPLGSWGEGAFTTPHGLEIVDDVVYCVDAGDHTVRVCSLDGQLRLTLGTPGVPGASGWVGSYDGLPGGPPFSRPTNVANGRGGDVYVSDGYANCKVHRFDKEGALLASSGPRGDFYLGAPRRPGIVSPWPIQISSGPGGRRLVSRSPPSGSTIVPVGSWFGATTRNIFIGLSPTTFSLCGTPGPA
jgi:hypothetical protein